MMTRQENVFISPPNPGDIFPIAFFFKNEKEIDGGGEFVR
jgi:hypothetical protein